MISLLPTKVSVEDGIVEIKNISVRQLRNDLRNVFKSVRPYNYIFTETNNFSVKLYEFFALEFLHVLEIIESHPRLFTSVRKINQIKAALIENTWLKSTLEKHPDIINYKKLKKFHFDPLPYQKDYLDKVNDTLPRYQLKGILLAAAPGTGKTYASLATAECLDPELIVILTPLSALETVWVKSIVGEESLYREPPDLYRMDSKEKYSGQTHVVCHFEAMDKLLSLLRSQRRPKRSVVICDESHLLNELVSGRTNNFIDICQYLDAYVVPATGTPVKALAYEMIPILTVTDPYFTDEVKALFNRLYAGEASKTTEILNRRLNILSHRIPKKVIGLKESINEKIKVQIPNSEKYTLDAVLQDMRVYTEKRISELRQKYPDYRKVFDSYVDKVKTQNLSSNSYSQEYRQQLEYAFAEYLQNVATLSKLHDNGQLRGAAELMKACTLFENQTILPSLDSKQEREEFKEAAVIVKYYKLKVQGECLGRVLGKTRIEAYREVCKHIPYEDIIESTEKKTLVFSTYVQVVESCYEDLKQNGYEPLRVHGEFNKDLASIVTKFDKDPDANPLIATYASLSSSVPLTMADTLIIVNPPYREYILTQTIARIERKGQTSQTRVFTIALDTGDKKNICDRTEDIIEWSRKQSKAVLSLDLDDQSGLDEISLEDYTENQSYTKEKVLYASW